MRFIRYVLLFLITVSILTVVGLLAWQELVLFTARQNLAQQLEQYSGKTLPAQAYEYCKELGTVSTSGQPLFTMRVRFTDSKNFVVEAVCDQYEFAPLEIAQTSLSPWVVKVPGTAGFEFGPGVWRVDLQAEASFLPSEIVNTTLAQKIFSRRANVVVADGRLSPDSSLTASQPNAPITSCEGYGFTCCIPIAEQGVGESRPASDCSASCFTSCQPLPQVYWLATSNGYDRQQRTATVGRGELVTFSFVGETQDPVTTTAVLDFGDGQKWQGAMTTESVNHQYECKTSQCQYVATLTLTDQDGISSVNTDNASLTVLVR